MDVAGCIFTRDSELNIYSVWLECYSLTITKLFYSKIRGYKLEIDFLVDNFIEIFMDNWHDPYHKFFKHNCLNEY